ncbi:MAG: site-specific integrase, partial [Clostridiales bacterium]|nr:site-specific integrase [Clostridiales bacterium]
LEGQAIKPSTYASYRGKIERHILPVLGEVPLGKITAEDIARFQAGMEEKGLGPSTIRSCMRLLDTPLQLAVEQHLILENPCRKVSLPKAHPQKVQALDKVSQRKLEQAALEDPNGLPVLIALYTGMRIGEICALRWEDVDLESQTISVRSTMQRISVFDEQKRKTAVQTGPPKSERSNRVIPMPATLNALLARRRETAASPYVIECRQGQAEPRIVTYWFHRLVEKAGLPPMKFHRLRHTFATRCMELGVDVTTLSHILGHSSTKMTLDIYTDSMTEQRRLAMQKLDRLFQTQTEGDGENGSDPMDVILLMLDELQDQRKTGGM